MSDARPSHLMTSTHVPESPAERAAADEWREGRPHRLGQVLREARQRAGLDLSDVAEVTHVRRAYLDALEEGRYAELPEDVYTRNFLRLYAQAVSLDDEPLLELYLRERRTAVGMSTMEQRLERDRRAVGSLSAAPGAAHTRRRRPAAPAWLVGPWLPTLVLVALVVGIGLWGFDQFFGRPAPVAGGATTTAADAGAAPAPAVPAAEPDAPAVGAAEVAAAADEAAGVAEGAPAVGGAGLAAPALGGVGASAALPQVRVDVLTVPAGASITIDGFPIPGRTPLTGIPVTGRDGRVVRAELEGHQATEVVADLSRDARVEIVLPALGAPAAAAGGEAAAAAPAASGRIQITVTEASWLEVWRSTSRNVGERLVYTTAQPGASYAFDGPVYVHVGNGGGVRVRVDGQDLGPMGAPGAVLGRAIP